VADESAFLAAAVSPERGVEPRSVGRYLDLGVIASGGMASVHFGRLVGPAGFTREVAIKRLHPHLASDPEFVAMLLDEARLAARILHANVVPTLDVVVEGPHVVVVMEYVRGLTLWQLLRIAHVRGERLSPRIASGIVVGVLHGLHAAHEATDDRGAHLEIVHRDVSPQNVLVGTDGVARLLDFGIAKAVGRLQATRDGSVKGKVAYMSPEQVQGATVTRRTDIYAAGVVLWEMLTGERLHRGPNDANVMARVLQANVKPPSRMAPAVSPRIDEVVLKATARRPGDRYPTARDMAAALERDGTAASATEIREWLAEVGEDALVERTRHIASLERGMAETGPSAPMSTGRSSVWIGGSVTSAVTHVTGDARPELSTIAEIAKPAATARAAVLPRNGRRAVSLALSLPLLASAIVLVTLAERGPASPPAEPPALAAAIATTSVLARSAEPLVSPSSSTTTDPIVHGAPPLTPLSPGSGRPLASAAPTPPRHKARTERCVPSTIDSVGHTHFNPACL
jgi:serine/threonine protein kinase